MQYTVSKKTDCYLIFCNLNKPEPTITISGTHYADNPSF